VSSFAVSAASAQVHPPLAAARSFAVRCPGELATVPAGQWDALVESGNTPLRHGLLMAWERSELHGLRSRPVVVSAQDSGRLIGASPGYFYDLDLVGVRWPQAAPMMQLVRRLWPRLLFTRTYEIGTAVPLADPFLVDRSQQPEKIVRSLLEQALQESRDGGASFTLVHNFTSCEGAIADELRNHGLVPVPIPQTAVVDVSYSSFEEYLGSMRAQYRRRANRTLAQTRDLSVEHLTHFSELAEEMARLWRAIYDRAREVRREVLTVPFFRQASEVEETSALLVRRPDGSIAAFALLLSDGPALSFIQCGFEQQAGRGEGSYFRLLYEIVRLGIEQGYRLVDLGITTLTPKLDVGAVPIPLYAWIGCRNPLMQRLIARVARSSLQDAGPGAPRRVFKQPACAPEQILAQLERRA
jgi:predicted N-acyltransferase